MNEAIEYYKLIENLENEIKELKEVIKDLKDKEDDIGGPEEKAKDMVSDTQNKISEFEKAISNLQSEIDKNRSEKEGIEAKRDLSVGFQDNLESLIVEWNKKFQDLVDARIEKNNKEKEIENKLKEEPNK